MPYIDQDNRPIINAAIQKMPKNLTSGELNFAITSLIDKQLGHRGLSYQSLNDVIGVLTCVTLELYRRVVAPYEDFKQEQNGDVYTVKRTENQ